MGLWLWAEGTAGRGCGLQGPEAKRAPCCQDGKGSEREALERPQARPDRAFLQVRCRTRTCSQLILEPGAQRQEQVPCSWPGLRLQPSGRSEPSEALPPPSLSPAFSQELCFPGLSVPFAAHLPPRSFPSPGALGSFASLLFLYQHKYPSASPERTRSWLLYPPLLHMGCSQR